MNTQTISVAAADTIQVEQVSGNLQLQGWDRPELEARRRCRSDRPAFRRHRHLWQR